MKIRNRLLLIAVASLSLFVLSSCSQRVQMTFYKNNRWVVESENTYSDSITGLTGDILKSVGIDIGGGSGFTNLSKSAMTGMFNVAKNQLRHMGIELDWSQKQSGNNTVMRMKLSASSMDKFNSFISTVGDSGLTRIGNGDYHLQIDIEGANQEVLNLFGIEDFESYMDLANMMSDYELRINTGKVIQSNADEVRGGTAIWYNPSFVDITFRPKSPIGIGLILIPILAVGGIVAIVAFVKSRRSKSPSQDLDESYYASDANYASDSDDFFSS